VFLPNLIEGRFPSRERREQIPIPNDLIKEVLPIGDYHVQEERRLFYVGMTRAQEKLIYSVANFYGEGKRERKISPFVEESLGPSWEEAILTVKKGKQLPLFEWSKQVQNSTMNDEPKTMNHKVDFLSYSAIDTFKLCPLHYKLRSILKIPTEMTSAQAMGNSIHLTLRDFYSQGETGTAGKTGVDKQKDRLLELLEANWMKVGYESKKHREDTFEKAKDFLIKYLESDIHQNARPILLEKSFKFWVDKTLKIIGKIDRVDDRGDGKIEIFDYKTGAKVPTQKEIDSDLQMTIYALAATDKGILNKSISQISMSFYYFDNAKKITTTRTIEQLEKAKIELLKIRDEIEASDFVCSHNMFCENCEYRMLCNN
jgi:DNA helicase-2/ATP-dependent DNA helicase PcrA